MGDFVGAALFNLPEITALLLKHEFKRIVLQFPDEHAAECVDVYDWILSDFESRLGKEAADTIEIYIAADSTYGSSVDDISAEHVDGDVLVYFGSDLSSSGAMPVLVVPKAVTIDVTECATAVSVSLSALQIDLTDEDPGNTFNHRFEALVTYEPGCFASVPMIIDALKLLHGDVRFVCAKLPPCADLERWTANGTNNGVGTGSQQEVGLSYLGGLEVPLATGQEQEQGQGQGQGQGGEVQVQTVIVYIGDKPEQLDSIALQSGQTPLLHFSNASHTCRILRGDETRAFRERFGGVSRVEQARVIGLIVGSMGLTGEQTRDIITRLQILCDAGGRKTYTFLMGRLNEAKLCNFPEIDIFCLVSNEDTSIIAPKTFPVPVITPWELELGLGAREWTSSYQARPTAIFDVVAPEALDAAVARAIEKRKNNAYLSDVEGDDDNDDDDDDGGGLHDRKSSHLAEDEVYREGEGENGEISLRNEQAATSSSSSSSTAVVQVDKKEGRLIEFKSAAAEFFAGRDWQGLSAEVGADEGASLEILEGLSGIASGYRKENGTH